MAQSIFNDFTRKYALSKTLRFELIPQEKTGQMLEDEGVFEKDRVRKEKYKQTKPFFDRLHRDFIIESLTGKTIDGLDNYFTCLKKLEKNKKDKDIQKEFKDLSQKLRTQVNNYFQTEKLFGMTAFDELKNRYGKEDDSFLKDEKGEFLLDKKGGKISIFGEWEGFTGYFDKFQETRKNFYKDNGTSTAIATRIIDQNLKRFCENIQIFESIKDKIDFKEVEQTFSIDLNKVFSLADYNSCLLQDGINIYNKILGGEVMKKTNEKLKGLNEVINKYRQDHKGEKISFFKLLDKQILSEKENFIENIEDDKELLKKLKEFCVSAEEKTKVLKALFSNFFHDQEEYELEKIYLSKEALNTILYKWMTDDGRDEFQKVMYEKTKKDKVVKFDKEDNSYMFQDFIALSLIKDALTESFEEKRIWKEKYFKDSEEQKTNGFLDEEESKWEQFLKIFEFEFNSLFEKEYQELVDKREVKVESGYSIYRKKFEEIINRKESNFSVSQEDKLAIKNFVDSTLWIYQMGKYFALEKKRKWLDEYDVDTSFYRNPEFGFKDKFYDDAYEKLIKVRMLLQSYLTKKPFNTDKWKLNFDHSKLLQGFTESKTEKSNNGTQYGVYILRKKDEYGYKYFLGVSKNAHLFSFFEELKETEEPSDFERLNYYQIKTNSVYGPSYEGDYQDDKVKLSESSVIQKIKNSLSGYVGRVPLVEKILHKEFKTIKEIRSDINQFVKENGRSFVYRPISKKQFQEAEKSKNSFFLFEIKTKDFSHKSNGNKNLHTLYFEELISGNATDIDIGSGEIFYRPKTDDLQEDSITTKKNRVVIEKNGKKILHKNRYLEDKSFLHLSLILNCNEEIIPKKETAKKFFAYNFNQKINEFLLNNPDINILGLDRGEKHLIYFAGIDQKGNFLKDKNGKEVLGSLNEINGVDYHKLLEERAKGREKARQDWQNIENIKDLKKGYISLVVRKLADLIIEHNAILVFEDLNMRFKQIRGGIEKSVYQQLEKALIEKLNFLVSKGEKDPEKAGHLLRAFQLTAPFTTFKDMGKQTGVIFYTQASYTSKTCPECGFRPNVKWDQDSLLEKINITFSDNHFQIAYKMSDFLKQKNSSKRGNKLYIDRQGKDDFNLSTKDAIRYKWFSRNRKDSELKKGEERMKEQTEKGITIQYNITECLKRLLEEQGIDYKQDIAKQISDKVFTKKFFKDFAYYLYLLSSTRSSISGTDIDQINCPCCGFHSNNKFRGVDFNGDANGAYNIARKGLMILEKVNQYHRVNKTLDKMNWGDLFIDIEEWDKFTQSQWNPTSKSQS